MQWTNASTNPNPSNNQVPAWFLDLLLGIAVTVVIAIVISADQGGSQEPDALAYLFACGFGGLMLARRRFPVLVLVATMFLLFVYYALGYPAIGLAVPVSAALYSAAESGRLLASIIVSLVLLIVSTTFRLNEGQSAAFLFGYELVSAVTMMAAAIALGDGTRSRRALRTEQEQSARLIEQEHAHRTEQRVQAERLRMARDLHDVIGHSISVISLHADVIAPYVLHYANEEQKKRWLPGIINGTKILSIGMTEPGTGSDLAAVTTKAVDMGDHYLLNGSKTFISNGYLSDLCIVVARTGEGQGGISLLMVERGMPGFERGRKLKKIGLHAQDTSELHFNDVKVPKANLIGKLNAGFRYLMMSLAQERLVLAISNIASAETVLDQTVKYCNERKVFGKPVGSFQNTRFSLTDMYVEQEAARSYCDRVVMAFMAGEKVTAEASAVKLQCSEMLQAHVTKCLQFFGGYGFMMEYPIAKAYLDCRVQTIYAGTSEIMREIVSKNLGLAST